MREQAFILGCTGKLLKRLKVRMVVSKTASRTVLGSMNDFVNMLSFYPPGRPLRERALMLAESPCSPIGMDSPKRATLELFGRQQLRLVK